MKTYVQGLIVQIKNIGSAGFKENGEAIDNYKAASDLPQDQQVTRTLLQQIFQTYGEIKYIEYLGGSSEAFVRFKESSPDAARNAFLDAETKPLTLGGQQVQLSVLSGDAEGQYWGKILAAGDRKWQGKKQGGRFQRK